METTLFRYRFRNEKPEAQVICILLLDFLWKDLAHFVCKFLVIWTLNIVLFCLQRSLMAEFSLLYKKVDSSELEVITCLNWFTVAWALDIHKYGFEIKTVWKFCITFSDSDTFNILVYAAITKLFYILVQSVKDKLAQVARSMGQSLVLYPPVRDEYLFTSFAIISPIALYFCLFPVFTVLHNTWPVN